MKCAVTVGILVILISIELSLAVLLALFPYASDIGLQYADEIFPLAARPLAPSLVIGLLFGWLAGPCLRRGQRSIKLRSTIHFLSTPFQKVLAEARSFSGEHATRQRYLANWLALTETYLFLTVLLLYGKSDSILEIGGMLLSTTLLLTHPST